MNCPVSNGNYNATHTNSMGIKSTNTVRVVGCRDSLPITLEHGIYSVVDQDVVHFLVSSGPLSINHSL